MLEYSVQHVERVLEKLLGALSKNGKRVRNYLYFLHSALFIFIFLNFFTRKIFDQSHRSNSGKHTEQAGYGECSSNH